MAVALISEVAVRGAPMPDTGSLHADLVELMAGLRRAVRHPLVNRIIPAVASEAGRPGVGYGRDLHRRSSDQRGPEPCGSPRQGRIVQPALRQETMWGVFVGREPRCSR